MTKNLEEEIQEIYTTPKSNCVEEERNVNLSQLFKNGLIFSAAGAIGISTLSYQVVEKTENYSYPNEEILNPSTGSYVLFGALFIMSSFVAYKSIANFSKGIYNYLRGEF